MTQPKFAGIDFPSLFEGDNFSSRRTTGHNLFDPESLLTGEESAAGFTYANSKRNWNDEKVNLAIALIGEALIDTFGLRSEVETNGARGLDGDPQGRYHAACAGDIPVECLPDIAPRVFTGC